MQQEVIVEKLLPIESLHDSEVGDKPSMGGGYLYEPDEGEKKIVDHMRSLDQKKSNYLVYSPDSDVILLCLLLNNNFNPENPKRITKS